MELDEMDRLACIHSAIPEGLRQYEQIYFLSMRSLYREFIGGFVSHEQAAREKLLLRREYYRERDSRRRCFAMYCQYQENIRNSQLVKIEILKGAKGVADINGLFLLACRCIAAMTHDEVFARQLKKIQEDLEQMAGERK